MLLAPGKAKILLSFVFAISLSACDSRAGSSIASDSNSEKLQSGISKWELSEDKDPITDQLSRFAALASNESDQLYMAIVCSDRRNTDSIVLQTGEYNRFEVAEVIMRIDKSEPVKEPWFVKGTMYTRAYDGQEYIDSLYEKMEDASKLTIRTRPMDPEDQSVTLTFDIRDIEKARQYVLGAGACAEKSS